VLRRTKDEKRALRRAVKEQEEAFRRATGRRLLRDERKDDAAAAFATVRTGNNGANVYQLYKNSKAKMKLIDALLSKTGERQSQMQVVTAHRNSHILS
jgi:hypothetical protein